MQMPRHSVAPPTTAPKKSNAPQRAGGGSRPGVAPSTGSVLTKKNYALPPVTLNSIQNIRQETNCSTDTEVIKRAVALYDEVVRCGGVCMLEEPDGTRYKYRP
jgi:hypothetical protein